MEQKPAIRALIFDLGGVILRTDDPAPRTALAQELGISRPELERIVFNNPVSLRAERGQATPEDVWAYIARQLNRPVEEMPSIDRAFFAGDRVDFQLIELIRRLREHYRTAMLSNTWQIDLPRFLRDRLQIPDAFDVVISSAKMGISKPDPEIFRLAVQMVGARPEESLFVDDNFENVTAASLAGLHTVRFFNPDQLRSDLQTFIDLPDLHG